MSKIGIVIRREYLTRVKKKSFIILTFLMPILFVGLMFGTVFLALMSKGEVKNIVVIDQTNTGEYVSVLEDTDQYRFIPAEDGFSNFREESNDTIYAHLVISGNLLEYPDAITLYSQTQVVESALYTIETQFNEYLSDKKLASYNIPGIKEIIEDSKVEVNLQNIKWDDAGNEVESSAEMASMIGIIFTFLIYLFIFSYGGMVMSGVLEEKMNRIIEVMVSSVKPFDLMMGKLVGIGLVGLTQFGLWALLIVGVSLFGNMFLDSSEMFAQFNTILSSMNLVELSLYFVLFFICGYLMYASLFAAIGAMVNSQEDTQQYMMPITVLIVFAFVAGTYSAQNPDGPLAFWASIIPFTSPIVMMVRLPFGVPWWELALSIALLIGTVILTVMLAAKIYRTGILMYGKKPSFQEIIKWLKY
ncbi:ABC transporter permease [Bacteroidales bacterium OttesenSCG-928-I14]|nr:ABC transporter permease [Bacteroidales bacterium OttesenSCG-928-I14]